MGTVKDITSINTSVIFPGGGGQDCRSLSAICRDGIHYLIVSEKENLKISASRDLRRWGELVPLSGMPREAEPGSVGRAAAFKENVYFCCQGVYKDSDKSAVFLVELKGEGLREMSLSCPAFFNSGRKDQEEQSTDKEPVLPLAVAEAVPALAVDPEDPEKLWCLCRGEKQVCAWTRDLENWQEESCPEFAEDRERGFLFPLSGERAEECSVVWDEELSMYVKYYIRGEIRLAVSRNLKHWQYFERDRATSPERGVIYDGDYYRALPFGEYIHREKLRSEEQIFDIRDYGAIADGATLSTEAFLAAAEAARDAGGGILLVSGGYYCVGSVRVYSNTTLWIDVDSALVASKNLDNYDDALLTCLNVENVRITGGGKIIGNGEYFAYLPLKRPLLEPLSKTKLPPVLFDPMGYPVDTIRYAYRSRIRYAEDKYAEGLKPIDRPMYTVWISGCESVRLENIIIEGALDWTLVLDCSRNVKVRDLVINGNRHVANTDGIDIMGCDQVEISHSFISCADDGICIKAPRRREHDGIEIKGCKEAMRGTSNVHITDCTVVSVMNAFKIGTETYFDIENVTMEKCRFLLPDIFPGTVSGISIESADGAHVKNIRIRDIEMDRVCCPVFICLNMRNKYGFDEGREDRKCGGAIEDIRIENVSARQIEVPSIITGFKTQVEGEILQGRVRNIQISGFEGIYRDNIEELHPGEKVCENIRDYPENNAFGDVPAYGFYIRHGDNVTVENCSIIPRSMNRRECIIYED